MLLKDLRTIIGNQAAVNITVSTDTSQVTSGKILFFDADSVLDTLKVTHIQAKDNVLMLALSCGSESFSDFNWPDVFNQDVIVEALDGPDVTVEEV